MSRCLLPIIIVSLPLLFSSTPISASVTNEPFGARVSLALDRSAGFADRLARQASIAHPIGSSENPAAGDFLRMEPFDFSGVFTATTNQVFFREGAYITGVALTGAYRLEEVGTWTFTYIRTDTHKAEAAGGSRIRLDSNQFSLGYSHQIDETLSVGAGIGLADANLRIDDSFMGFPRSSKTTSIAPSVNAGILYSPDDQLLLGGVIGTGWSIADTKGSVLLPFPFPPVSFEDDGVTWNLIVGLGAGYRFTDDLAVFADVRYLHLQDKNNRVDVARFGGGVEWFPVEGIAVRGGITTDHHGNATYAAGLGIYLINRVPIEIAYRYDAFPETNAELGRAGAISVGIVLVF